MREAVSTNVTLGYSSLEVIGKKLVNKEALFDFSDGSEIRDFDNVAIVLY